MVLRRPSTKSADETNVVACPRCGITIAKRRPGYVRVGPAVIERATQLKCGECGYRLEVQPIPLDLT